MPADRVGPGEDCRALGGFPGGRDPIGSHAFEKEIIDIPFGNTGADESCRRHWKIRSAVMAAWRTFSFSAALLRPRRAAHHRQGGDQFTIITHPVEHLHHPQIHAMRKTIGGIITGRVIEGDSAGMDFLQQIQQAWSKVVLLGITSS